MAAAADAAEATPTVPIPAVSLLPQTFASATDLEAAEVCGDPLQPAKCPDLTVVGDVSCVACHRVASPLKLLSCLHVMCVPCLGEHIDKNGKVSCFKCLRIGGVPLPGARLEQSLVDWPRSEQENLAVASSLIIEGAPKALAEDGVAPTSADSIVPRTPEEVCQIPECEGEFQPATSRCVDCGLHLCEGHEKVHKSKRNTSTHTITPLAVSASNGSEVATKRFVENRLGYTARKCALHPHCTVNSYCGECEVLVCERCCKRSHANHSGLEDIDEAASRKREVWKAKLNEHGESWRMTLDDAKDASMELTQEINDKVETLSEEITSEFDEHIKSLRQRQQHLLNELDGLRWKALKRVEKEAGSTELQRYQLDCCEHLVNALDSRNLVAAEKILDKQISDSICHDQAEQSDSPSQSCETFNVSFEGFVDGEKHHASQLGSLVNADHPREPAKMVRVHPRFDPFSCTTEHVSFSHDGYAVEAVQSRGYVAISTMGSYCHGAVECHVYVQNSSSGVTIGVLQENCAHTNNCTPTDKFLGWFGSTLNSKFLVGDNEKMGGSWQDGDIITLRLDCDKHTLTGIHQRTGQSETIAVPRKRLCFGVQLGRGAHVRIL